MTTQRPVEAAVLPAAFLERLRRIVPPERWDEVLETFAHPKPTSFRVNTLRASAEEVTRELAARGLALEPVPWYPGAYMLTQQRLADLQETAAYRTGAIYVQGLSSLLPVLTLDPQPGETVLDLAAAPGSKTTQIACRMAGRGRLVANDNNRIRFYKLRATVAQQGAAMVECTRRHGETFGRSHPEAFDRVLVDAPCGTEGRFYTGRASSYRYWRPGKIHEMVVKQRRLVRAGWQALKPGGRLVYATCTFAPEENEAIIHWLLEQAGERAAPEPVSVPVANSMPALTGWGHQAFHPGVGASARVLPTRTMEGFFLAALRKR